jgi:2-methylisocitrate lyase-like PEP mutase family enzyme
MRAIGKALPGIPLVANMVEGGKTPVLPLETLHELGFTLVLYANTALRAQILATQGVLRELRQRGSSLGLEDRFCSWAERQRLVRLPEHEALERRYAGN